MPKHSNLVFSSNFPTIIDLTDEDSTMSEPAEITASFGERIVWSSGGRNLINRQAWFRAAGIDFTNEENTSSEESRSPHVSHIFGGGFSPESVHESNGVDEIIADLDRATAAEMETTDRQLAEQIERADRMMAEERERLDREMAAQMERDDRRRRDVKDERDVPPPSPPQASAEEPDDDTEFKQCKICMDTDRDTLFLPCAHLITCAACARMIRQVCPVCNARIRRRIKVFFS